MLLLYESLDAGEYCIVKDILDFSGTWDYGINSWNRVFEENFMRAVSIWVCNINDIETAVSKAHEYACNGFIYIPTILECFNHKWTTPNDFRQFLKICLEECGKINSHNSY